MRVTTYFSLLAICLPLNAVSAAQQINAVDRAEITRCLSEALAKKGNSETCVGVVADPCISAASTHASYEQDAKTCAARELAVWDERLSASLKTVNGSGLPGLPLTDAQANWQKSRDKMCALFDKIDIGMYLGGSVYCMLQETGHRDLILERLVAAVSEH